MSKVSKKLHRLKSNKIFRDLCSETDFTKANFVQPLFVNEALRNKEEIIGLKDNFVMSLEDTLRQINEDISNGVNNFLLFISSKNKSIFKIQLGPNNDFLPSKIPYGTVYIFFVSLLIVIL